MQVSGLQQLEQRAERNLASKIHPLKVNAISYEHRNSCIALAHMSAPSYKHSHGCCSMLSLTEACDTSCNHDKSIDSLVLADQDMLPNCA